MHHLILGAGCAGLSLAVALVREGVDDRITVVDARQRFVRDRTWCLFDVGPTPFTELAKHRWTSWQIGGATATAGDHPYLQLDSADVYTSALSLLRRAPNVRLRLGERVLAVGDGWARTDRETLQATWVYDALAVGSPALRRFDPGMWQAFAGEEVVTDAPVFDPGVATLMDFSAPQRAGALAFFYVLPTSDRRALVEHTSVGGRPFSARARANAIAEHLRARGADRWHVAHREHGTIPMTTTGLDSRRGDRTIAIGTAGGAVRPSSGYAFGRIQTQVTRIARAVAAGRDPDGRFANPRVARLDSVFLDVLAEQPDRFPAYFRRLAQQVPGPALARFLGDAGTLADEARVIAAMPKAPFAAAALAVATRAPRRQPRSAR